MLERESKWLGLSGKKLLNCCIVNVTAVVLRIKEKTHNIVFSPMKFNVCWNFTLHK